MPGAISQVILLPTVSCQSVLVSDPHVGPMTRILLLSDTCGVHVVGTLPDERTEL
jgi:hypothetical protein